MAAIPSTFLVSAARKSAQAKGEAAVKTTAVNISSALTMHQLLCLEISVCEIQTMIIPLLQMRKLTHGDIKQYAQTGKYGSEN